MGLVDVNIAGLTSAQGGIGGASAAMRSTISAAEQSAVSSQAFHQGESSAAFQASHARFLEAATKVNVLMDLAEAQLGEGATTYVVQDMAGATDMQATVGALPDVAMKM